VLSRRKHISYASRASSNLSDIRRKQEEEEEEEEKAKC